MSKIITVCIILFLFMTAAHIKRPTLNFENNEPMDFEKEMLDAKLELQEADARNQILEVVISDDRNLKRIKRNINKNK